jgi:hypothetical protein
MITADQMNLLTAAVDAELSPQEARRLRRLLDSSAEARAAYARLKADSDRLRNLPRVTPLADLHKRVMARVATATPPHTTPARKPEPAPTATPSTLPFDTPVAKTRRWVPAAIAASLLLTVTGTSFWFFRDRGPAVAHNPNRPPPATHSGAGDPEWAKWLPAETGSHPAAPMPSERRDRTVVRNDTPPPFVGPIDRDAVATAPEPRAVRGDLIGSRIGPQIPPFDLIDARVPFLRPLTDFEREDVRMQFVEELGRDPAFRIDLFARDPARAVQSMQAAAKAAGVNVHADAAALGLVNKRQGSSVVVYTDSLTAADLADLFARLCAEDEKISPRVFGALHATPVLQPDQSDLRAVLGIDPGLFKRPAAAEKPEKMEKGIDSGKPISAGTADHIVKSVTGKAGEKSAVLLTWSPSNLRTPPANSAELKQFLTKRGERKPNAVPVLIVIRPGNG